MKASERIEKRQERLPFTLELIRAQLKRTLKKTFEGKVFPPAQIVVTPELRKHINDLITRSLIPINPDMKPSEKYWRRSSQPNQVEHTSPDLFKKTYDELLSSEAKLEILSGLNQNNLIKFNGMIAFVKEATAHYQSEYDNLVKLHQL